MKVTLDTNVLLDYLGRPPACRQDADARAILEAHRAGKCHVVVTTRVFGDVALNTPLEAKLNSLLSEYKIEQLGTVGRYGESFYGSDLYADGSSWEDDQKRLLRLIWPDAQPHHRKYPTHIRDVDHLLGHRHHGNDVFVTRDDKVLKQRDALRQDWSIEVISPRELVERLRRG